jgi:membrane associated rhomboid family serine protease
MSAACWRLLFTHYALRSASHLQNMRCRGLRVKLAGVRMLFPYADDPPPEGQFAWMNWLIIAVNTAVFLAYGSQPDYDAIVMQYGFIPADFNLTTMFTAMFLHASWMHLLGNMWFLYLVGDNVENRVGPFKYAVAYLLCGLAGSYSHYLFFMDSNVPSIGASGAIFGVMGMYLFLMPRNRMKVFYFIFILIGTVSIPAYWFIGIYAALELLYSRMSLTSGIESGIGHLAHAGGFVAGAFMAVLYASLGLIPATGEELWALLFAPEEAPPARRRPSWRW